MKNNFDEVSTDIINAISNLHYEDKQKEMIRLKIMYVLCKMVENEQVFNNDVKALDENERRKR